MVHQNYTFCFYSFHFCGQQYSGPPICGHPHQRPPLFNEARISENQLCILVFKIPLTRGHPSNQAKYSIPQGWPHKRGTTVNLTYSIFVYTQKLLSYNKEHWILM